MLMAATLGDDAQIDGTVWGDGEVQITLRLPADRAEALLALARRRGESVGLILRQWVERALVDDRRS